MPKHKASNRSAAKRRLAGRIAELSPIDVHDPDAWRRLKDEERACGARSLVGLAERWAQLMQAAIDTDRSAGACLREANYGTPPDDDTEDRLYLLLHPHWHRHPAFLAVLLPWRYGLSRAAVKAVAA